MRQRWASNEAWLLDLLEDRSPLGRARLDYFLLNKGPWSELDEDRPFLDGLGKSRPAATSIRRMRRATKSTRG